MTTPEPPAGYEIREYKPGEVVGEGALCIRKQADRAWGDSYCIGGVPTHDFYYCEPIRPRELRWYDLSKGEKPNSKDSDQFGNVLYRESTAKYCLLQYYSYVASDMKEGYWHPIAKFPKPDPEETAAIELLRSRGYRVEKEKR